MTQVNLSINQKAVNGSKNICFNAHCEFPVLVSEKRAISMDM